MSEDPAPSRPEPPEVYAELEDGIVLQLVVRYVGEVNGIHRWVTAVEDLSAPAVRVWTEKADPRSTVRVLGAGPRAGFLTVAPGPPPRSRWQRLRSWVNGWSWWG